MKYQLTESYLSIVHLIFVIDIHSSRSHHTHGIRTYKEPHQIKEVAALLHQSTPCVFIEPIPIVDLENLQANKIKG